MAELKSHYKLHQYRLDYVGKRGAMCNEILRFSLKLHAIGPNVKVWLQNLLKAIKNEEIRRKFFQGGSKVLFVSWAVTFFLEMSKT